MPHTQTNTRNSELSDKNANNTILHNEKKNTAITEKNIFLSRRRRRKHTDYFVTKTTLYLGGDIIQRFTRQIDSSML